MILTSNQWKPQYEIAANSCTQRPITYLNKMGLTNQMDFEICNNPMQKDRPGFIYKDDGRIKDGFRGQEIMLDRPARIGCINIDETYSAENVNYNCGAPYKGYHSLNNAQITYYQDETLIKPFNGQGGVYTLSSYVDKAMLVDPMGGNKPQYYKNPVSSTLNSVSKDQATKDALFHREDLMSRQQALYNRTSWNYYNN